MMLQDLTEADTGMTMKASWGAVQGLEALAKAIDEMKKALRKSSRFSVKMDEPTLPAVCTSLILVVGWRVYQLKIF